MQDFPVCALIGTLRRNQGLKGINSATIAGPSVAKNHNLEPTRPAPRAHNSALPPFRFALVSETL